MRTATEWVMIGVILALVAFDLVAAQTPNATISEITINWAYKHPALWWLMGCLMAHLSWPVVSTRPHWQTILVVIVTISAAIWLDLMRWLPAMMPILPLVVGIPCGHLLWPQKIATATGASLLVQTSSQPTTLQSRTQTTTLMPPEHPLAEKP